MKINVVSKSWETMNDNEILLSKNAWDENRMMLPILGAR